MLLVYSQDIQLKIWHGESVKMEKIKEFFKAKEGTLFAEAREISCSRKIASYVIDVTDKTGEKTAVFQGMVYRKDVDLISRQD